LNIAVIGAGIAGLACARQLVAHGHSVVVLERADAVGGRIASLRTEIGGFDHGAQYFTTRHAAFVDATAAWCRDGVVEPWVATPGSVGESAEAHRAIGPERWVGVPSMAALPTHLASGLDVRVGTRVLRLERDDAGWIVHAEGGDVAGRFDAIAVALPSSPAAELLASRASFADELRHAHIEPCWALMAGFVEAVVAPDSPIGDGAFVNEGRLAWIARESSKPERRPGERWTAHAQSAWSVEHFDDDPEDIKTKLVRAFQEATGTREQPIYAHVYRWRHALVRTSLSRDFLWDAKAKIGACGDWCRGYRVEDAWLSGVALAGAISSPA